MSKSYIKLGELASYINGYAFKPKDRGSEGLPIIRIQDLTGSSNDKGFYKGTYPSKIEINNGDVLISWSASLGVYVWNNGKALLNQHIFKVVFDKGEIDKDYFVYAVQFSLHRMRQLTHGATMKHVVKKDFENVLIPYPSLKDQRKVAHVLDKLKESINKKMDELKKLDELIKARFVEMFGDPFNNQKKFNMVKLGDIAELISGGTPSRKNMRFYNGNIPFITTVALGHTYIESKHAQDFITIEGVKNSSTKIIRKNTLLVGSRVGVGKTSITDTDVAINQDIVALNNIDLQSYDLFYLKAVLDKYQYYFDLQKRGATIKGITAKIIKQVQIPVAPIELQEDYHYFVQQVDKSKFENIVYLNKTLSSKILSQLGDAIRD
ncbi:restriction endonuclease subunit S [Lactobacillus taiwanensis]|uniref:restriction endonuclease subunit S n=1 Tax=Lactobacillus taiwanensis TaxID=508451 RepID=UPI00214C104C|nr:restriction endonuclease subunit S [Lactobacillus taiwanensis]MCR1903108.1 restriction endonuclease subunit S [Lactobacillus taiwanensis]